jgi:hypothetical protein
MEGNPDEMMSVTVHEEVSKEEAAVKSFGALKKRHGDWHLAVRRRRDPKEWIWEDCGSWKKLAASCRSMTCHAGVARRKGNIVRKNRAKYNVKQGAHKEWTFRKRHRTKLRRLGVITSEECEDIW